MNYSIALDPTLATHRDQAAIPRSYEMDSILAQQVKAGELLDRLYTLVVAAATARTALRDDPNQVPDLLIYISEQAQESYKALMRAIAFS